MYKLQGSGSELSASSLKNCFYTGLGLFYAGLVSKPVYWYPLVVLLVGVAGTELWAYKDERGFLQFKTVGEYQQGVANDYNSSIPFKNMVDDAYGGATPGLDVEIGMWQV